MSAEMRTGPAARDAQFRGIDPDALHALVKQVTDAGTAIRGWLSAHRPPPGVPETGYRRADEVAGWTIEQLGMLSRRYNYAITHPDRGGGVTPPPASPAPGSGADQNSGGTGGTGAPKASAPRVPRRTAPEPTPRGAGDIGNFPTQRAAAKAARTDALAVQAAVGDRKAVPADVWKHLAANSDDPDYTTALYERLGPAGVADLLAAAHGDEAKLKAVREALGVASHHATMDVKWLRTFLDEADRAGVRPVAVQVVTGAEVSARTREAIARLDLRAGAPAAPKES
ncbi:hypothetical protein [Actinomadura parmotrematis]|uniref:Uncharacterized protein n=1 Tax=Actinomadura parmotrematis TaxID=2864039 RepID=A0ABS7FKK6_9ACTN|nr:hypothetical protein [Actinomadura parmotrematis]MBW8480907.1 hypothetical protein [Actinomadura parmotrematis]